MTPICSKCSTFMSYDYLAMEYICDHCGCRTGNVILEADIVWVGREIVTETDKQAIKALTAIWHLIPINKREEAEAKFLEVLNNNNENQTEGETK